jgi:hypothetical protein
MGCGSLGGYTHGWRQSVSRLCKLVDPFLNVGKEFLK